MPRSRILLIGAGHAHLQALRALREAAVDLPVTLVSDAPKALYSGMAPGCIAGLWPRTAMEMDPRRFLLKGDEFVVGRVMQVDRAARRLLLEDGARLDYGLLSINVGAVTDPVPAHWTRTVAVKPLDAFLARTGAMLSRGIPRSALVLGAGAAGVEIAFALRARGVPRIALLDRRTILENGLQRLRSKTLRTCARLGISVLEDAEPALVEDGRVTLADGVTIDVDLMVLATGGRAPSWLARSGLPVEADGALALRNTLQLVDDDNVFAVGDCARVHGYIYAGSGVQALRQAPILARNLVARAVGAPLIHWRPQANVLSLINVCDGTALGARNGVAFEGRWVRRLKDWLDRRFVASLS